MWRHYDASKSAMHCKAGYVSAQPLADTQGKPLCMTHEERCCTHRNADAIQLIQYMYR